MSRQPKPSFPFAPGGAACTRFALRALSWRRLPGRTAKSLAVTSALVTFSVVFVAGEAKAQSATGEASPTPHRRHAGGLKDPSQAALQSEPVPPSAQARPTRSPLRDYPSPPPRAGRGNSSARPTPTRAPASGGDDTGEWLRSGPRPHPRFTPIRHGGPRGTPPPHETATPGKSSGTMIGDAGPPRNITPVPTPPLVRGQFPIHAHSRAD